MINYYTELKWKGINLADYNNFGGFQVKFTLLPSQIKYLKEFNKTTSKPYELENVFNYIVNRTIDILNLALRNNLRFLLFGFDSLNEHEKQTLIECVYLMVNSLQGKGFDIDYYYDIKDDVSATYGINVSYNTNFGLQDNLFDKLPFEVRLKIQYLGIRDWTEEDFEEIKPIPEDAYKIFIQKQNFTSKDNSVNLTISQDSKLIPSLDISVVDGGNKPLDPEYFIFDGVYWTFNDKWKNKLNKIGEATSIFGIKIVQK